jgi:S-adenosylmethionine decarboxylase
MVKEVLGVHHIAELCECNAILLNDSEFISTSLRQAVEHANATLIEEVKYEFTPQGITAVCLLSESHISIHIFTCGDHTAPDIACRFMADVLESKHPIYTILKRGI